VQATTAEKMRQHALQTAGEVQQAFGVISHGGHPRKLEILVLVRKATVCRVKGDDVAHGVQWRREDIKLGNSVQVGASARWQFM